MDYAINFPNLGIHLEHVGKSISIFGFEIAYYGIVIGIAMLAGISIALWVAKKTGQDEDAYFDAAIWGIIFSLICARLYYVIFSWDQYKNDLLSIFNTREGGLAIYGGVIGAVITIWCFSRKKRISFGLVGDTVSVGLVLGQIIGRWGNFFNREAFGGYTDNLLAMQLPVTDIRASEITQQMLEHQQVINGIAYVQVHPTFLYESMWNLGVFLILLGMTFLVKKRFGGMIFLFYLLLYGSGRFWIEGLRTDQLLIPGTALPVSQVLSGVLAVSALVLLIVGKKFQKGTNDYDKERTFEKKH